jgi:hypothetical protein
MAILAGVGAQSFELTPQSRPGWRRLLVACVGLIIAGLGGSLVLAGRTITFLTATSTLGIWLILSIGLLLATPDREAITNRSLRALLWQCSVIVLVAIDLLLAAFPLIPTLPATIFNQPIARADFLKAQSSNHRFFVDDSFDYSLKFNQYFRFDSFGPLEIDHWQGLRQSLAPNLGVYASLPSANNDDPLVVGHWRQLTNLLKNANQPQRTRLLSLMNVGYFIDEAGKNAWPVIYEDGEMTIQCVPRPLPQAYFVSQIQRAKDESEVIARLIAPDFDPGQELVIMEGKAGASDQTSTILAELSDRSIRGDSASDIWAVVVKAQGPGQVLLVVEAPTPGFVVLTDTFYPGWQATIDGQAAQIWPANLAFRAVMVEAGVHEIIFSYRPRSFTIGLWVSTITLLLIILICSFKITIHLARPARAGKQLRFRKRF